MTRTAQEPNTLKPLVGLRGVGFAYAGRPVLSGINLCAARGRITAILGPSGCGKTTLLRLIGGQLRPAHGSVRVAGREVPKLPREQLFDLRKRMGMLFQNGALLTDLDVFENVAFPLREHTALPERMIRDLVALKLEAVGLRGARELMPAELSGGMARRVALARALALDPDIVLYDEPFTGQDPISMGVLLKLIKHLNEALGLTSIVVSHDVQETLSIADYAYLLAEGRVVGEGTPSELMRSDNAWSRQFLDGAADGPSSFHYPAGAIENEVLG